MSCYVLVKNNSTRMFLLFVKLFEFALVGTTPCNISISSYMTALCEGKSAVVEVLLMALTNFYLHF